MASRDDQQLPAAVPIGDLVQVLHLLGVGVGVDESVPTLRQELAHSVIGAAEHNAIAGDQHARAARGRA